MSGLEFSEESHHFMVSYLIIYQDQFTICESCLLFE